MIKESLRDAISHREECRRRSAEACAAGAVDKQTVSELSVGAYCRKVSVSAASFYR